MPKLKVAGLNLNILNEKVCHLVYCFNPLKHFLNLAQNVYHLQDFYTNGDLITNDP